MSDLLPYTELPLRVLLVTPFMVLVFAGVIAWVYRRNGKQEYSDVARMPLDDE